ncbi:23 kDa integral membrane protein [Biomphalaria pfeifferi]|uniref:23 kDa integral membrane protein n=1 Tax=Biomphalaria pfeifferi TaxID=112525 RepID=A0AAD8BP14_BIOPF|nr:23 kDa integral membrane protein [Biomphalaria pfeifferi]
MDWTKCIFLFTNTLFVYVGLLLQLTGFFLALVPSYFLAPALNTVSKNDSMHYSLPKSEDEILSLPFMYEFGLCLIYLGLFLFLISVLGCVLCIFDQWCSFRKYFYLYYVFALNVLIVAQLIAFILFSKTNSVLHQNIISTLKNKYKEQYQVKGTDAFSKTVNLVQVYFHCCAIDEKDFATHVHLYVCRKATAGCYTKISEVIQNNKIYAEVTHYILIFLQMFEVVLAIVLYVRKEKKTARKTLSLRKINKKQIKKSQESLQNIPEVVAPNNSLDDITAVPSFDAL